MTSEGDQEVQKQKDKRTLVQPMKATKEFKTGKTKRN